MKVICVDDERLLMEDTVSLCRSLPLISEVKGFTRAVDALQWLESNTADLALLDIDMPGMNGLELAAEIKKHWPDTAIIFLTGYSRYALEAFSVRASGYLLKPVTKERLTADMEYVLSVRPERPKDHIVVQTFGGFDVFVDEELVSFKTARCKELLAYLVDRRGVSVTRPEAFSILWEDRMYDRGMQKQFDVVIRSLRTTLKEYGIEDIFEMKKGSMRICPEKLVCDVYRFFEGDIDSINSFRGEYMSSYSWASLTESLMSRKSTGHLLDNV